MIEQQMDFQQTRLSHSEQLTLLVQHMVWKKKSPRLRTWWKSGT
jgi:hypothetical protein